MSKKRITILEDEFNNQYLLENFLENYFDEIHMFENGEELLQSLYSKSDVILLDIKVPGELNGIDVLKTLREIGYSKPIIMQTAYLDKRNECLTYGANDVIIKPFNNDILIKTIKDNLKWD
ncbi:MAG: response regulator [Nanoarchaeota archaeon]